MIKRRKTRIIKIRDLKIGGGHPIAIQSMVKTKTSKIRETLGQIRDLEKEGCQIIRLAIKDFEDVEAIRKIRSQTTVPLVGDIHFNFKLAIEAIKRGMDKIRLNPANIHKKKEIEEIVKAAKDCRIPIRVGVNSGSLPESKIPKAKIYDRMVSTALDYIKVLEDLNFFDIVVSLKTSDLLDTISAYRKMAKFCDYPFHLGVTATGSFESGSVKSAVGIGLLLAKGIGDTIRVSLTASPLVEVRVAKKILESLNLRQFGPEIISCPVCGRCKVDLIKIVGDIERRLLTEDSKLPSRLRIAVMGCEVNGPGEAKDADLGVAFGKRRGVIFKKGEIIKRVKPEEVVDSLLAETGVKND